MHILTPVPEYFGKKIRVMVDEENDNAPLFVAVDICKAIGIDDNATIALRKLDARDITLYSIQGKRGTRDVNLVSEAGFYELVLGSRKPGAVAFKRWVCSEVLPSIRRTGRYQALADSANNPVGIPEAMVQLARTLPADVSAHRRMTVREYVNTIRWPRVDRIRASIVGKIARRLMLTHDLPIRRVWKPYARQSGRVCESGIGTYPEAILDLARQEYARGRRD